jgi:HPt (histidine-containing phosphotransfer) domain-containing protein
VATAQCKRLRHFVDTAGAEWVATRESRCRKQAAARRTEACHGDAGVARTAWVKAAARAQQRAEQALVEAEQGEQQSGHGAGIQGAGAGDAGRAKKTMVAACGDLGYNTRPPSDNGEGYGDFKA